MSLIARQILKLIDYIPYKTHIYTLVCLYIGTKNYYEVYKVIKLYSKQCKDQELFYKRHNCVVFYRVHVGLLGWPPHAEPVKASGPNFLKNLYEPVLYFIKTAQKSLDIAMMLMNVKDVFKELVNAAQRGVKIRIILNFRNIPDGKDIRWIMSNGVECQFFLVNIEHRDNIMHHKFIVKDFGEDNGFLCTGSLNISVSSVTANYEQFKFIMQHDVVEKFHAKFLQYWSFIKEVNKTLVHRVTLQHAGLLSE